MAEVQENRRRQDVERHFSRLFQRILDEINNGQIREDDIAQAIRNIKQYFIGLARGERRGVEYPDMDNPENMCAYLFRYGAHGAGLTRERVLKATRNCEALLSKLKCRHLKIVSLGGGPGNDSIGFCSALFESTNVESTNAEKRKLDITVVELYENWRYCVNHVQNLATNEFFADVTMSFLKVRLPGNPQIDIDYFQRLQEADVILMVKLISVMTLDEAGHLAQSLRENMKPGAFLLYIDKTIQGCVTNFFEVLFESDLLEYTSSAERIRRFDSDDMVTSEARIAVCRKN